VRRIYIVCVREKECCMEREQEEGEQQHDDDGDAAGVCALLRNWTNRWMESYWC
jgi:hypothetical protein